MKLAIIGGSGSSGTTLLAHLLSKHSEVVSGPEMKFFNHPDVLSLDALAARQEILFARRCLPPGYHVAPTFLRAGREFGIDESVFRHWVDASNDARDLYTAFTRHMCEQSGTSVFVEKTPSNIYNFAALARAFPEIPLVHQIRDGRDVVASFKNRGKSLFHAASLWLYDTLCGLQVRGAGCYLETRYEDLAFEPKKTLAQILSHVGLDFEPEILELEGGESEGTYREEWLDRKTPRAWNQLPNQPVSTKSIGRWRERLTPAELSTVYRVSLTDRTRAELESPVSTMGELLDLLGYSTENDAIGSEARPSRFSERRAELKDFVFRAKRTLRYRGALPFRYTTITRS
jgi:hypothetical protein